jgi:hypothetical protein
MPAVLSLTVFQGYMQLPGTVRQLQVVCCWVSKETHAPTHSAASCCNWLVSQVLMASQVPSAENSVRGQCVDS